MTLGRMTRLPYAIARCSLPRCPRQAAWIGGMGFKLCHSHALMFKVGKVVEQSERDKAKSFNLDALGEIDDRGDVIADPTKNEPE